MALNVRPFILGIAGSLGLFYGSLSIGVAASGGSILPPSGVKAPYSPLAIPTKFTPLNQSLETLLDAHYHIITAHVAGGEEIFLLRKAEHNAICAMTMPDPTTDQNIVTSRCWLLNDLKK